MKFKPTQILVVFLFCITSAFSQPTIGIKGGYTHSWPDYGDAILPEDAKTDVSGFNVAVSFFVPINKCVKIGVEPAFVRRGASCFPGWQPVFVGESKIFLNYVEFPVLFQFKLPISKPKLHAYTNIGYGVSSLLSAFVVQESINSDPERTKIDLTEPSNRLGRLDHGFYGALGFEYSLGSLGHLLLESNLYYGMHDYDKIDTAKNRSINFRMGYARNIELFNDK